MKKQNFGTARVRDHVTPNAPGIIETMESLTEITKELFDRVCLGDSDAIRELSDLGRMSGVIEENLQPALDAAIKTIRVTGDYNKALEQITKQVRVSGTQILQSVYNAGNEETRMMNNIVEMQDKQANTVTAEAGRHVRSRNLIQIEGTTTELMAIADYQTRLLTIENRVPVAQQRADEAYRDAVNKAYWARGSEADISQIPRPNYESNRYGLGAMVKSGFDRFRQWMGI